MKIWFSVLLQFLFLSSLNAAMNLPQQISDLPPASRFQGNEAVTYHNGILYFVYLKNQANPIYRDLVLVKSTDQGHNFQTQIITTVQDYGVYQTDSAGNFVTLDTSVPTIIVEDENVVVTFHDHGYIYTAVSQDGGNQFVITQLEQGYDPLPLVKKFNDRYYSYTTNIEPTGDSLFTTYTSKFLTVNEGMGTDTGIQPLGGNDSFSGAFYAGTDLWIKHTETGNANPFAPGWPVFYSPVYTSGTIRCASGTIPYELIFRAGYFENIPPLTDGAISNYCRENGVWINPGGDPAYTITLVRVSDSNYTSWIGRIVQTIQPYELDVYTNYPPPQGEPYAVNFVAHKDTIWSQGPSGTVSDDAIFVTNRLWIEGTFSGRQVWCSADTVTIIGDIKLSGTPLGADPDGGSNPANANQNDFVAIGSEKNVIIGYGYKDPVDSLRKKTTIGDLWIYASIYALGSNGNDPHRDGVFTFAYQHPHPSSSATIIADSLYDMIDLHQQIYPQTTANPWPGDLDFPWYNPLWPEANPYMERGTIHLYGSIYQRRLGFVHREALESTNQNGVWDVNNHQYGTISQGVNYPGTTGNGVGYKKDYHNDKRLTKYTFPFSAYDNAIKIKSSSNLNTWSYPEIVNGGYAVKSKTFQVSDGLKVLSINNQLYKTYNNYLYKLLGFNVEGNIENCYSTQDSITMLTYKDIETSDIDILKILTLNFPINHFTLSNPPQVKMTVPVLGRIFDTISYDRAHGLLANANGDGTVSFNRYELQPLTSNIETWDPQLNLVSDSLNHQLSRMVLIPVSADSLFVLFYLKSADEASPGIFYLAKGQMDTTVNEDQIAEPPVVLLNTYPNPFNSELKINIQNNQSQTGKLEIYNLRGQLVRTIIANQMLTKGEHTLTWNGKNNTGIETTSGIYFLRAQIGDQSLTRKILHVK